ncbi:MAG: hypothetical protein AAFW68_03320 [Pseudomonadota bacterium]
MKAKDLRREQIALLRLEKTLETEAKNVRAGGAVNRSKIGAAMSVALAGGVVAAEKLNAPELLQHVHNVEAQGSKTGVELLTGLAEAVSAGHAAFEAKGNALGYLLVNGGRPKIEPAQMVASILGIG